MAQEIKNDEELKSWFLEHCKNSKGCVVLTKQEYKQLKASEVLNKKDYERVNKKLKAVVSENKALSEALSDTKVQLFAFVRNSSIAPIGYKLKKSQEEITDKTFETIKEAKKIIDYNKMIRFMNLASNKEDRYDN